MNQRKIDKIKKKVKRRLDKERYEHTLGVMYMAGALGMRYQADLEAALMAGLLHDCAKCLSTEKKIRICENANISITEFEHMNPGLLHAKLGSYLARKKYKIKDREVLDAIAYHTTGRPQMTLLDKIIYIADYIEPNRHEAPNLQDARRLAFEDIDKCLCLILKDSLAYLKTKNMAIDPMTKVTFEYYDKNKE